MTENTTDINSAIDIAQSATVSADAVLDSIAEFTEAVALIQAAIASIDQHTETAKQAISAHVETTIKTRINQMVATAVAEALQVLKRIQDLLDPFLDMIRRGS